MELLRNEDMLIPPLCLPLFGAVPPMIKALCHSYLYIYDSNFLCEIIFGLNYKFIISMYEI